MVGMYDASSTYRKKPASIHDAKTEKVATRHRASARRLAGPHSPRSPSPKDLPTEKVSFPADHGRRAARKAVELPTTAPGHGKSSILPWALLVLVAVGAASGAYYMYQKYAIAQYELVESRKATQDARHHVAEADNKIMALEAELSRARGEFKAARKRSGEGSGTALSRKLEAVVPAKSAELVFGSDGRLNLALANTILFVPDRAELSAEGKALLGQVAAVLEEFPREQVWVYGHAPDGPGKSAAGSDGTSQWQLSSQRALEVVYYLQGEGKISPSRMAAVSFGARRAGPRRAKGASKKVSRIELVLFPRNSR